MEKCKNIDERVQLFIELSGYTFDQCMYFIANYGAKAAKDAEYAIYFTKQLRMEGTI